LKNSWTDTVALDGDGSDVEELISSLGFFEETKDPAGPVDRIIFDSRSWIQKVPFTGISGKYWDVLLGRGLLLPSFEAGFIGAAAGTEIDFSFVFPDDYVEEDLRGKEVEVHAKIHKIFRSLEVQTLEDVKELRIANTYPFPDLDLLRDKTRFSTTWPYVMQTRRSVENAEPLSHAGSQTGQIGQTRRRPESGCFAGREAHPTKCIGRHLGRGRKVRMGAGILRGHFRSDPVIGAEKGPLPSEYGAT
jgi:hypothetical protein